MTSPEPVRSPAPEAGHPTEDELIRLACRAYDRGRARNFDDTVPEYQYLMREEFRPVVRSIVAALGVVPARSPREPSDEASVAAGEAFYRYTGKSFSVEAFRRAVDAAYAIDFGRTTSGAEPPGDER